ncbi:MAG: PEGA domain-containing protein [Candidatus Levybacteria bacterium]|nr:PEGA domain-containing protein [Candidatus Levybacteria bacterium]
MKKVFLYIAIFLFLIVGTIVVVLYGRGYNFSFGNGKVGILGTGLLAATSQPDGAGIYINNHLTSATNNTISLSPGIYDVKIAKSGYFPWEKKIKIEKEVVSTAYALLLPIAPKLENITNTGIRNPVIDPSRTKIAYTTSSSGDSRKNGIYILDMSLRPILTLQSSSTQIADDTLDRFSEARLSWSPDAKELVATISAGVNIVTTYLLKTSFNENPQDVTATLSSVEAVWLEQKEDQEKSALLGLKAKLVSIIKENFQILAWSEDGTKFIYEATQSANLPSIINPPLIGTNSTPEERTISKGAIYTYDVKEDKNFKILDSVPDHNSNDFINGFPLTWFTDSKHLVFVNDKKISIMDYDGQNRITVYAGPFIDDYVFAWPDGSKILILTDLGNPAISPNLYTISLK